MHAFITLIDDSYYGTDVKITYPFPEKSKRKELTCAFSNSIARFNMRSVSYIGKKKVKKKYTN